MKNEFQNVLCVAFLAILLPSALFASDATEKAIDLTRLKGSLPSGWIIHKIERVQAPFDWKRTSGGSGLIVKLKNPEVLITHPMTNTTYNPAYSFSIMPLNWQGVSGTDHEFKSGTVKYIGPDEFPPPLQMYPQRYVKTIGAYHIFESYIGHGDWKDPFNDVRGAIRTTP